MRPVREFVCWLTNHRWRATRQGVRCHRCGEFKNNLRA